MCFTIEQIIEWHSPSLRNFSKKKFILVYQDEFICVRICLIFIRKNKMVYI